MSIFRPLNSDESNLFTIRNSFKWATALSNGDILADQSTAANNSYLETPTYNNLPQNFKVTYVNTGLDPHFTIEYGKSFTSHPTIFATIRSADATIGTEDDEALTPCVSKQTTLSIAAGTTNATVGFRNESGALTYPPTGFEIILVGPIKVGVTTGNSNKGWSIGSGNDPNTVYSYLNVGINTGNPSYALEVAGAATFRNNVTAITDADSPVTITSQESNTVYTVDSLSNAVSFLLPTPVAGLRYKFIVKDTGGNEITITSTSDGSSAASISYANIIAGGTAYSQTTLSDVLTLGNSSYNHTIGDYVECICDGTNWWWSGVVVVASSVVLS
jgi:hypothetical protein